MRDNYHTGTVMRCFMKSVHHYRSSGTIEVAGRFIGQKDRRVAEECSTKRYPLRLPSGYLSRSCMCPKSHSESLQELIRAR